MSKIYVQICAGCQVQMQYCVEPGEVWDHLEHAPESMNKVRQNLKKYYPLKRRDHSDLYLSDAACGICSHWPPVLSRSPGGLTMALYITGMDAN